MHDHAMLRGAAAAVGASLMFAAMGAAVKVANEHMPAEMVVFFRNLFGLLVLAPWILQRGLGNLRTQRWRVHLIRSLCGLAAMYCFFIAVGHLPLAEAVLLKYSSPLFIAVIALLWLGETPTVAVVAAIVLGFAGVTLVLQPGFGELNPMALVGLAAGLFAAVAMVSIRRMSTSEPTIRIVSYFSLICTAVSAIPLAWAWQTPGLTGLAIMVAAGGLASAGQMLLTYGYSQAPAARIGPYSYATVVFAVLMGWMLWGETPGPATAAGIVLVCTAGVLAMSRRGARAPAPEDLAVAAQNGGRST